MARRPTSALIEVGPRWVTSITSHMGARVSVCRGYDLIRSTSSFVSRSFVRSQSLVVRSNSCATISCQSGDSAPAPDTAGINPKQPLKVARFRRHPSICIRGVCHVVMDTAQSPRRADRRMSPQRLSCVDEAVTGVRRCCQPVDQPHSRPAFA